MKKHVVALLALILWAGAAFAQTPADSNKTPTSELLPSLSDEMKKGNMLRRFGLPQQKQATLAKKEAEVQLDSPEQVTPIYSNMPMVKIQKKREPMPSATADESSTRYHLLKKRYKVLPIPSLSDSTASQ